MAHVNENYAKLPGTYLFATIAKKVTAYEQRHPERRIIRLGIGDVTRPLAPAIIDAMHKATAEMGSAATFRGYGPEQGYEFLRAAIIKGDYETRGVSLELDEVFIGDGAKTDVACIQDLFGADLKFAVADPVYPVYLEQDVMTAWSTCRAHRKTVLKHSRLQKKLISFTFAIRAIPPVRRCHTRNCPPG